MSRDSDQGPTASSKVPNKTPEAAYVGREAKHAVSGCGSAPDEFKEEFQVGIYGIGGGSRKADTPRLPGAANSDLYPFSHHSSMNSFVHVAESNHAPCCRIHCHSGQTTRVLDKGGGPASPMGSGDIVKTDPLAAAARAGIWYRT